MSASPVTDSLLALLARAVGVPARLVGDLPQAVRDATLDVADEIGRVVGVEVAGERYRVCRFHRQHAAVAVVVLGPWPMAGDPAVNARVDFDVDAALREAARGLGQTLNDERQRLELATQLEVVGRAVLAVTGELALDTVLLRIVDLARELSGARYAALGVLGPRGDLAAFLTSGMDSEEEERIGPRPRGHGILGLLLREPKTIRLPDLMLHPDSYGFPPHHPPMHSFLGVPIVSRGRVYGNLYLTEKRTAAEFSDEDARVVELLARHAGVAIENARLYEALEEQQRRLQLIVDQMPEAVLIAEADPERITLANPQASALLGWEVRPPLPLAAFLARNVRAHGDRTPLAEDAVPLVRSLREGVTQERVELRTRRPDGTEITMLVNSVPLVDESGRVASALAIFQDITQIKDAEQLKDDFLSLVAHELRTPLTTIQGGALLLQRDWAKLDATTQSELLADIATESRRLSNLIENMVQLANIRAGRLRLQAEPTRVPAVLVGAVEAVRQLAPERDFRVTVEPQLLANADPGRVDQVTRNLVHNAVKYSPPGSPVEIDARRVETMVEIAVRDYGPGISAEHIAFVFERFRRSEQAIASGTPGLGLGLYLARHLIEAQGGRIWIERPEGGGTRVTFSVPALAEDDE